MKKIFALLMTVCLLVGALCVAAFAAEAPQDAPDPDTVMRVSALKNDDTTVKINDYTNFEIGWNAAIDTALANSYKRVIVDFYANWNAAGSVFGSDSGNGFDNETIYIPEGVNITINLNEHTIDRALNEYMYDGEVMYIEDDSDVIINNGTIKGGWSANGAGGIHVKDDVTLTLNNVNIVGNTADDADGGGISLESDSVLTMNGGRFENNLLIGASKGDCGGALYVSGGTAILNGVTFKNNLTQYDSNEGSAIYVTGGELTLNECTFEGNSLQLQSTTPYQSSVIYAKNSTVSVNESTFGNHHIDDIFQISSSALSIESSVFTGAANTDDFIDIKAESSVYVTDTIFTDSSARVIAGTVARDSFFRNCTFNNTADDGQTFAISGDPIEFYDCNFGNTKHDSEYINIVLSNVPKEDALIGITIIFKDGTTDSTYYYDDLVYGWNIAIGYAASGLYDRIIVDLYSDWKAVDGEFCNDGIGFSYDAIYFPENARVTLNMNGHTINRAMTTWQYNGEVICIDENADVIINGGKSGDPIVNAKDTVKPAGVEMGTITGGWSANGAGGIHILDNAKVQLNNVRVDGNIADDDNGGGIAIYDGASLVMNGGSLNNNILDGNAYFNWDITWSARGGGLYANDATAVLNGVEIKNNKSQSGFQYGIAVFSDYGDVTLNACVINGNGLAYENDDDFYAPQSVIDAYGGKMTIKDCNVTNNCDYYYSLEENPYGGAKSFLSILMRMDDANVVIENSLFENNRSCILMYAPDTIWARVNFAITNSKFINNTGTTLYLIDLAEGVYFEGCEFNNNVASKDIGGVDIALGSNVIFRDCNMGDSTYSDGAKTHATFENSSDTKVVASIFGEGSLAMIFALLALVASGVSIFLVVYYNKKKAVPVTADNAEETVEEE